MNDHPLPPTRQRLWDRTGEGMSDWTLARRLLIVFGLAGAAYLIWKLSEALLLVFAAVVLAVLLRGFANWLEARLRVSPKWSLGIAASAFLFVTAGFLFLLSLQVFGQLRNLVDRLPEAVQALGGIIRVDLTLADAASALGPAPTPPSAGGEAAKAGGAVASRAMTVGLKTFGAMADLVVVLAAAVFLAADPSRYVDGALLVLPPTQRARAREAFEAIATALRQWFLAQLIVMAIVGAASAAVFMLLGVPGALALGVIAAVAEIVPIVGPVASGALAALMAATVDATTMALAILAAVVIQQIEGNILTPRIQAQAVDVPGALVIFAIVAFGALFGVGGVMLAMPLALCVMILVQKLWVNETLGENVPLAGSEEAKAQKAENGEANGSG